MTYFSTWGPLDGMIRALDGPSALGLVTAPDAPPMPVGIAFHVSHAPSRRGPIAVFRLTVGKDEVPGRWVCVNRRLVPLEEWQEREAIRDEGE